MSNKQRIYKRSQMLCIAFLACTAGAIGGGLVVNSVRKSDVEDWKFIASQWENLYGIEKHKATDVIDKPANYAPAKATQI